MSIGSPEGRRFTCMAKCHMERCAYIAQEYLIRCFVSGDFRRRAQDGEDVAGCCACVCQLHLRGP